MPTDDTSTAGNSSVKVTAWQACYNDNENIIALSCTVTASDSKRGVSGVGLLLNTSGGETVASCYAELSNDNDSVTPALNLPSGNLKVGDSVTGVVTGEAAEQHFSSSINSRSKTVNLFSRPATF